MMDLSDVGVRHAVQFGELRIKHIVEVSPVAASIARDLRYCVIAVIVGLSTVTLVKTYFAARQYPKTD